tara:strand:- start:47 stop:490 length:444 start_codon:yes stop_codon:yes gene_type:complete
VYGIALYSLMKSLLTKQLLTFVFIGSLLYASSQAAATNEGIRFVAAQNHLLHQPNKIAIHAKGFVCNSCGIGLRIHLKKIAGINRDLFDEGIFLDASKQLLVVAFESAADINIILVRDAIYSAGYDPEHYYAFDGDTVMQHPFAEEL